MLPVAGENGGSTEQASFQEWEHNAQMNWKFYLEHINNFLIENSLNFPYEGEEQEFKNIAIVYSLVRKITTDQQALSDVQLRLKRTNEDLKNYQNLASKYQQRLEQLKKDFDTATVTAKIANEALDKMQSECSAVSTALARLKAQNANKEKLFLVDFRKKELEIDRMKEQLTSLLKGNYKQIDANAFFIEPSITNFEPQPKSTSNSDQTLQQDLLKRMEEMYQVNQNSFVNLKNILSSVYFSLATLVGIQTEELLHPVELNSFDEPHAQKILDSFGGLLGEVKRGLRNGGSLISSEGTLEGRRIMQLEQEKVELEESLREKVAALDRNSEMLQLSLKNETCKLEQERNELVLLKEELDTRTKKLEEDRKRLMEMMVKYYQERQVFLEEKKAFEIAKYK